MDCKNVHRNGSRGFTLIEVLIAVIIMGFMMVGFLKLQTSSIIVRAHAKHLSMATQLAADKIDDLMAVHPDNVTASTEPSLEIGKSTFTRKVTVQRNTPSAGWMTVTVETGWKEKQDNKTISIDRILPQ
jgi:prepilin-type N-terminal cleavage/methylation domain-containing protein